MGGERHTGSDPSVGHSRDVPVPELVGRRNVGAAGPSEVGFGRVNHEPDDRPVVRILGTHGVPAGYGGFETAAENVGLYLAARGWRVVVYCQVEGTGKITEDRWCGLERVNIPVAASGWRGTGLFDLAAVRHASRFRDPCLLFGYNTAVFNSWQRLRGTPLVINMDGIEWSRARWGAARQAILYINERIACLVGNALIADHPEIERYLLGRAPRRKIFMITYGADAVSEADVGVLQRYGLEQGRYLTLICRPIPENSILELVEGFSSRRRDVKLVVLGDYSSGPYQLQVKAAASDEVVFLGSVYEPEVVSSLRYHSRMYLHGHTVGGTNPSLVEAMAAGNPILAHDNVYNRWTAGPDAAVFFRDEKDVSDQLDQILDDPQRLAAMARASRSRHSAEFTWPHIAGQYEALLARYAHRLKGLR